MRVGFDRRSYIRALEELNELVSNVFGIGIARSFDVRRWCGSSLLEDPEIVYQSKRRLVVEQPSSSRDDIKYVSSVELMRVGREFSPLIIHHTCPDMIWNGRAIPCKHVYQLLELAEELLFDSGVSLYPPSELVEVFLSLEKRRDLRAIDKLRWLSYELISIFSDSSPDERSQLRLKLDRLSYRVRTARYNRVRRRN